MRNRLRMAWYILRADAAFLVTLNRCRPVRCIACGPEDGDEKIIAELVQTMLNQWRTSIDATKGA